LSAGDACGCEHGERCYTSLGVHLFLHETLNRGCSKKIVPTVASLQKRFFAGFLGFFLGWELGALAARAVGGGEGR
jgi:hypothetical protein